MIFKLEVEGHFTGGLKLAITVPASAPIRLCISRALIPRSECVKNGPFQAPKPFQANREALNRLTSIKFPFVCFSVLRL